LERVWPLRRRKTNVGTVFGSISTAANDSTNPMKGHPGYWGDESSSLAADLVKEIDSPQFNWLFDNLSRSNHETAI